MVHDVQGDLATTRETFAASTAARESMDFTTLLLHPMVGASTSVTVKAPREVGLTAWQWQ